MIIYAGVDGTSTYFNDPNYEIDFRNSFVNKLSRSELVKFSAAFYHRGPSLTGHETYALARMAHAFVISQWQAGLAKAVFLAGYSRGAAAVTEVAHWLKADGIPVECLILFDAVDRSTPGPGGGVGGVFQNTKIASTVQRTIHPMRDIVATRSRISFQRCSQVAEDPAMPFSKQYFFGTHAAIGGTPWKTATDPITGQPISKIWEVGELVPTNVTPVDDAACAAVVASWVYPQIIEAYQRCVARLGAEPPEAPGQWGPQPPKTPERWGPKPDRPRYGPGGGQTIHTVQPGDWLSKIAITYYGDMNKWTVIYNHPQNKQTIGPNPDLIKPGQRLVIP